MTPINRRRSRADDIHDELRRMIVTLELAPREVLSEKYLCDLFVVSRTPVREAILRLAEHGLVEVAPQHGTFVSGINPRAVRQAHFLRESLEIPVLRRLCAIPHVNLDTARALVLQQHVLAARNEFAAFLPLDDAFHESLFQIADLKEIWGIIHGRKAHLDRIRFLQAPQPGKLTTLVEQHEAILDAIVEGAHLRVEEMIRSHVSGAVAFMEDLLVMQPDLFDVDISRPRRMRSG